MNNDKHAKKWKIIWISGISYIEAHVKAEGCGSDLYGWVGQVMHPDTCEPIEGCFEWGVYGSTFGFGKVQGTMKDAKDALEAYFRAGLV